MIECRNGIGFGLLIFKCKKYHWISSETLRRIWGVRTKRSMKDDLEDEKEEEEEERGWIGGSHLPVLPVWAEPFPSVVRAMGGEGRTIHSQAAPLVRPVDAGQHFNLIRAGHPPHERSTTKIQ